MKKLKIIEVDWIDAAGPDGWVSRRGGKVGKMKSVGIVIGEDKKGITITHSVCQNHGEAHAPITIPKCSIKKMRTV